MKKFFGTILVLAMLFFGGAVEVKADPFLVCDAPTEIITNCEVEITQGITTNIVPGICSLDADGDYLLLDLATRPNGMHTFRARWAGEGGWWSNWSLPFDASKPGSPGSVRIK